MSLVEVSNINIKYVSKKKGRRKGKRKKATLAPSDIPGLVPRPHEVQGHCPSFLSKESNIT